MASLDMSLEDMINRRGNDKVGRGQGRARRGRGALRGGRLFGAPLRNPLGVNARPSSFPISKSIRRTKVLPWHNGLFQDGLKAAGLSGLEVGTKLFVSNLDDRVSNQDIRELFSEIGELIRYAIHFDKNGRPSGSAEVIFARRSDAFQAFKRYNNVQLDGKPIKIEIIGSNVEAPIPARVNVAPVSARVNVAPVSARINVAANGRKRTVVMAPGPVRSRGGFAVFNRGYVQRGRGGSASGRGGVGTSNVHRGGGRGRGSGGRGRGRGGTRWVKKNVEKSADDLDKELDSYHNEAMQS